MTGPEDTWTLSDYLSSALHSLHRVREIVRDGNVERHREAVLMEVAQGELAVSRVIGLIAGAPER